MSATKTSWRQLGVYEPGEDHLAMANVFKTTGKMAIEQAREVASDDKITDGALRSKMVDQLLGIAQTRSTSDQYGRVVYRLIAGALGLVAVLVIVLAFVAFMNGDHIDSAFYALGSAAIGGLGGVLAPHAGTSSASQPAVHEVAQTLQNPPAQAQQNP